MIYQLLPNMSLLLFTHNFLHCLGAGLAAFSLFIFLEKYLAFFHFKYLFSLLAYPIKPLRQKVTLFASNGDNFHKYLSQQICIQIIEYNNFLRHFLLLQSMSES